jgi:hypothetical protein
MRLPLHLFVIADAIAAAIGHTLLFFLAFWFGDQFRELVMRAEHTMDTTLRPLLILVGIVAVAAFLLYHFYRRPVTTGDPGELPLVGERVAAKIEQSENRATRCPEETVAADNQPLSATHREERKVSAEAQSPPQPGAS